MFDVHTEASVDPIPHAGKFLAHFFRRMGVPGGSVNRVNAAPCTLAAQEHEQAPIAEPATFIGQIVQPLTQLGLWR
ncbi:hypothetical protein, partial [Roseovarius salis]|uniref:hypothetical protein n=1 Tax=Roseovarius salis TaxID=3376063 RepID=UPI0037CA1AA2